MGLVVACVNPVVYPRTILKCSELNPFTDSSGLEYYDKKYYDYNKIESDFRRYTGFIYSCWDDTVTKIINLVDGKIMDYMLTKGIRNF
jgi:hypothetical protein